MENALLSNQVPESSLTRGSPPRRPSSWRSAFGQSSSLSATTAAASNSAAAMDSSAVTAQPPASALPVITQIFQCPKWKVPAAPKLPNARENKPLAMYFLAEEKLASAVALLEKCRNPNSASFKEAADRVHMCQRILLNTIYLVYSAMDSTWKSSRSYRQYLPDEDQQELNRSFSESILFAAQAISRGFQIRGIEERSDSLNFPATELCASLDALRFVFRHRAAECTSAPYELLYPVLSDFDRAWTIFERQLCFAYFDVGGSDLRGQNAATSAEDPTADDDQQLAVLTAILSETVMHSVQTDIVSRDAIEYCDPAAILAVPRLAIVHALLHAADTLRLTDPDHAFWWFRPHSGSLTYIQTALQCLEPNRLATLERMLASGDASVADAPSAAGKQQRAAPTMVYGETLTVPTGMRGRREATPMPPPSPVTSLRSSYSSAGSSCPTSPLAESASPPWAVSAAAAVYSAQPSTVSLHDLFVRICQIADGLQSGTFAKPFLSVMQKVFTMHAGDAE
ncbi:hypothetical protein IWQ60_007058 [Tieghemiomyces parasiticus]|uniref:Uncharacterized protein n=1 Tax=Tieghemiomyces parasiticus TaxID=78921 RepID=A0A9W8A015_9FUNG|nr:hypothetical protein IWQ60_007058 [Tieghemiomyces parasiticus]